MNLNEQLGEFIRDGIGVEMRGSKVKDEWDSRVESNARDIELGYMEKYFKTVNQNRELPDQQHSMIVEKVWLEGSDNGTPLFRWRLKVIDDELNDGIIVERHNTLSDSHKSFEMFYNDLKICGVTLYSAREISDPETWGRLIGKRLVVQKVTRNGGQVSYYLKNKLSNGNGHY